MAALSSLSQYEIVAKDCTGITSSFQVYYFTLFVTERKQLFSTVYSFQNTNPSNSIQNAIEN